MWEASWRKVCNYLGKTTSHLVLYYYFSLGFILSRSEGNWLFPCVQNPIFSFYLNRGVRCLARGHHGRAGGELGPLQVAVHTPYLGLFGDLNRRPYGSQSKPLLTEPLPDRKTSEVKSQVVPKSFWCYASSECSRELFPNLNNLWGRSALLSDNRESLCIWPGYEGVKNEDGYG